MLVKIARSVAAILVVLVLAWGCSAWVAVTYPAVMLVLEHKAQQFVEYTGLFGLPDSLLVRVDLLLSDRQLVLMGFIAAVWTVLTIIGAIIASIFRWLQRWFRLALRKVQS